MLELIGIENLESDLPANGGLFGQVDRAHATLAQLTLEHVGAEFGPRREFHHIKTAGHGRISVALVIDRPRAGSGLRSAVSCSLPVPKTAAMSASADWNHARDIAMQAARAGAAAAMPHFRRPDLPVDWKADASPVTVADKASEDAAKTVILGTCPEDGWLGEETGSQTGSSGRSWIVDPIDGTRNFVRGIPLWSVLVACIEDGPVERVIASVIGFPAIDEWYDAIRDGGARCNGQPIQVSTINDYAEAGFAYYTHAHFATHGLEDAFRQLSTGAQLARGGGDAYMHCLVASGRMDLCVEPGLAPGIWQPVICWSKRPAVGSPAWPANRASAVVGRFSPMATYTRSPATPSPQPPKADATHPERDVP